MNKNLSTHDDDGTLPGVQILGDDLGGDTPAGQSPAPGETAAAAPDPLDGIVQKGEVDPFGRAPAFWIGAGAKALLDKLMKKHAPELEALKIDDAENKRVAGRHKVLTEALAQSSHNLEVMEGEIGPYLTGDIAESIYRAKCSLSLSVESICVGTPANPSQLLTAMILQAHGKKVLELAKAEHGELQRQMRDFCQKERVRLKQLGLL